MSLRLGNLDELALEIAHHGGTDFNAGLVQRDATIALESKNPWGGGGVEGAIRLRSIEPTANVSYHRRAAAAPADNPTLILYNSGYTV